MYNGVKYFFTFALGAAVGSVASWAILKNRFERIAQEEIDSVISEFSTMYDDEDIEEENEKVRIFTDEDRDEYESITSRYKTEKGGSEPMYDDPRVISPREFQENEDYDTISLNYYADGVLADDMDELVEDVEETVGNFKEYFGEYENDTVYVVNDRLGCYYEICADDRNYSDVATINPNLMDD